MSRRVAQAGLVLAAVAAAGLAGTRAGAGPARAQEADAKTRGTAGGLAVARQWCARCHVVEAGQTTGALDAAPPFADIAKHPKMTPSRLRGFLSNPHGRMPGNVLTRDGLADLIAYIESLRP